MHKCETILQPIGLLCSIDSHEGETTLAWNLSLVIHPVQSVAKRHWLDVGISLGDPDSRTADWVTLKWPVAALPHHA